MSKHEEELIQAPGDDGKIYVHYDGPDLQPVVARLKAALLGRSKFINNRELHVDDPQLKEDTEIVGEAYRRVLTELACWTLVVRGELMVDLSPAWVDGDKDRRVEFFTLDNKPVVLSVGGPKH